MLTTDSNWESEKFADRVKNKHVSVFKKLDLENLRVYWNTAENNFISSDLEIDKDSIIQKLNEQNEIKKNNIIDISLQAFLEQKTLSQEMIDNQNPSNKLQINLNEIKINWRRDQMIQLQKLMNIASKFKVFLDKKRRIKQMIFFRPTQKWTKVKDPEEK